jgi:hypothetical protein
MSFAHLHGAFVSSRGTTPGPPAVGFADKESGFVLTPVLKEDRGHLVSSSGDASRNPGRGGFADKRVGFLTVCRAGRKGALT